MYVVQKNCLIINQLFARKNDKDKDLKKNKIIPRNNDVVITNGASSFKQSSWCTHTYTETVIIYECPWHNVSPLVE